MADTPKKKPRRRLLKPVPDDAYANRQLNLFQEFLANTVDDGNALSNAIDLWDSVPRFSISRKRQEELRLAGGFLPISKSISNIEEMRSRRIFALRGSKCATKTAILQVKPPNIILAHGKSSSNTRYEKWPLSNMLGFSIRPIFAPAAVLRSTNCAVSLRHKDIPCATMKS